MFQDFCIRVYHQYPESRRDYFLAGKCTVLSLTHTLSERIIIFSVCLLVNMCADVGKVMMAGKLRKKLTVHNLSIINKISGAILMAFGMFFTYTVSSFLDAH